jgi:hypothetical protein
MPCLTFGPTVAYLPLGARLLKNWVIWKWQHCMGETSTDNGSELTEPCTVPCKKCGCHWTVYWLFGTLTTTKLIPQILVVLLLIHTVYLWPRKVSERLVFTQNWVKLHQTSCKHKLNVFLSKIEYADHYHIWKPLRYLAFSASEQNPRG